MACPKCGCKVVYTFDDDEDDGADDRLQRCAACGAVFDLDDHTDEDDECERCRGDGRDPMTDYLLPCPACAPAQGL